MALDFIPLSTLRQLDTEVRRPAGLSPAADDVDERDDGENAAIWWLLEKPCADMTDSQINSRSLRRRYKSADILRDTTWKSQRSKFHVNGLIDESTSCTCTTSDIKLTIQVV